MYRVPLSFISAVLYSPSNLMSLNYFCTSVYDDKSRIGKYSRVGIALSTFAVRSTYVTYFLVIVLCRMPSCVQMLNVWHCLESQEVVLVFFFIDSCVAFGMWHCYLQRVCVLNTFKIVFRPSVQLSFRWLSRMLLGTCRIFHQYK